MILFLVLLASIAITRLIEMNISRVHRRQLFQQGALAAADPGFVAMVLLHVGILAGSLVEVLALHRSAPWWLAAPMAIGVVAANALRVWAIRSLGRHWNVRIVNSTSLGIVESGPYRYVRHPNYVAVFLELAFLPLVCGAWMTAVVGTILHFFILRRRIRNEEAVLLQDQVYARAMAEKPRFIPHYGGLVRSTDSARRA